jgi:hypothetical protein
MYIISCARGAMGLYELNESRRQASNSGAVNRVKVLGLGPFGIQRKIEGARVATSVSRWLFCRQSTSRFNRKMVQLYLRHWR